MCAPRGKRGAKPKMHVKMCDAGSMVSGELSRGWRWGLQKQPKANQGPVKSNTATPPTNKKNSGRTTERNLLTVGAKRIKE